MKHFNFKLFCLSFCMILGINAFAYDAKVNGIYYKLSDKEATVTFEKIEDFDYASDYSGDIVIPETITFNGKTYSVTCIGDNAFSGCKAVTSVTIPGSVTSIGWGTFWECLGLTTITIPSSVTSLSISTFGNCRNLTSVKVESSTPPTADEDSFLEAMDKNPTLYVPAGSKAAYQAADVWKQFKNIVEYTKGDK